MMDSFSVTLLERAQQNIDETLKYISVGPIREHLLWAVEELKFVLARVEDEKMAEGNMKDEVDLLSAEQQAALLDRLEEANIAAVRLEQEIEVLKGVLRELIEEWQDQNPTTPGRVYCLHCGSMFRYTHSVEDYEHAAWCPVRRAQELVKEEDRHED